MKDLFAALLVQPGSPSFSADAQEHNILEALASYQRHTFFNYSLAVCACEIECHIKVEMGEKEAYVLAQFHSLLPSTSD